MLTLPANLALAAGFNSYGVDPEQPEEDSNIVPSQIASAMGVDPQGDFRSAPIATLQAAETYGRNPTVNAGRVGAGKPPAATVNDMLGDLAPNAGQPNVPVGEPHPSFTDPKLWQAVQRDPKRAAMMYETHLAPGHNFQQDMQRYLAIETAKEKQKKEWVEPLIKKGLEFDDITGDVFVKERVKNPASRNNPNAPAYIDDKVKLEDDMRYILYGEEGKKGGYELLMGKKPPQPLELPPVLRSAIQPQEEKELRQRVRQIADDDSNSLIGGSNMNWEEKKVVALKEAVKELHQKQEMAKAAASNATLQRANPQQLNQRLKNIGWNTGINSDLMAPPPPQGIGQSRMQDDDLIGMPSFQRPAF